MRIRIPWYRKVGVMAGMIIFWILAFGFFYIIRFYGWEEMGIQFGETHPVVMPILGFLAVGALAGLFISFVFIFIIPNWNLNLKKWPIGLILILKIFINFIIVKILLLVGILAYSIREQVYIDREMMQEAMTSNMFRVLFLYFFVVSTLLSFLVQLGQKIGPQVLGKMLLGRYRKPREEERIFMFLDLKSSTSIAEKLGHVLYSQLLQACFADISQVVINNRAEIYQYVGDEIVLSWKLREGLRDENCIRFFFSYQEVLNSRESYYKEKFGLFPEFKAGIHIGTATVAEVGLVKREIAYHGDVLNTASRIQGACNRFEQKLLVSRQLIERMGKSIPYHIEEMGSIDLRGKQHSVKICSVVPAYS